MSASDIFSICNLVILAGWLLLLMMPNWKYTSSIILNFLLVLFAVLYTFLLVQDFGQMSLDSFNSLAKLKVLFQSDSAVLAGWVHYLIFDLFVGTYIVSTSIKIGLPRWVYTCILPFAFMCGPISYLIFVMVKITKTKSLVESK